MARVVQLLPSRFFRHQSIPRRWSHHDANATETAHRADPKAGDAELQAGIPKPAQNWWESAYDGSRLAQTGAARPAESTA